MKVHLRQMDGRFFVVLECFSFETFSKWVSIIKGKKPNSKENKKFIEEHLEKVRKFKLWKGEAKMFDDIKLPHGFVGDVAKRAIDQLNLYWNFDYGRTKTTGKVLELATGGWSENEEIIGELMGTWFWCLYWTESKRGGYYKFTLPDGWEKENVNKD